MPIPFLVNNIKVAHSQDIESASLLSQLMHRILMYRAGKTRRQIDPFVKGPVLDIGLGAGHISYSLRQDNFKTTGIDVVNLSVYPDIQPVLYDGSKMPFRKNQFQTALLMHVLHHCGQARLNVLSEALRVSKQVIIIEDIYRNNLEWALVSLTDQLGNFEFYDHDYWTVPQWRKAFKKLNAKITYEKSYSTVNYGLMYSRYCLFVISKK